MAEDAGDLDPLKPLGEVLVPDERWAWFGRTLEDHHAYVSSIALHDGVPVAVRQHFENARNAWLYAFFAYRLLSVALLALMVACEAAVRARAEADGTAGNGSTRLQKLLERGLLERWFTDEGFAAAAEREAEWNKHRAFLLERGEPDIGEWPVPLDDQEHARVVADGLRRLRNALAHGRTALHHNLTHDFQMAADLINQLFSSPPSAAPPQP